MSIWDVNLLMQGSGSSHSISSWKKNFFHFFLSGSFCESVEYRENRGMDRQVARGKILGQIPILMENFLQFARDLKKKSQKYPHPPNLFYKNFENPPTKNFFYALGCGFFKLYSDYWLQFRIFFISFVNFFRS